MDRSIESFLEQEYPIRLRPLSEDEGGGWLAEIPDLPGCMSDGETQDQALRNLSEAKETWIRTAIKRGLNIPLPTQDEESPSYSGRLTLRLPKTLHFRLAERSRAEGVSLNQFILSILASEYGALVGAETERSLHSVRDAAEEELTSMGDKWRVSSLMDSWKPRRPLPSPYGPAGTLRRGGTK